MALDKTLLGVLVCPESRDTLAIATADVLGRVNTAIEAGTLKNRAGHAVDTPVQEGLVRADGQMFYAIVDEIPNLLIDEAIDLRQLG